MATRYWVGDSGNWASSAHWSATSGGVGGASVPGEFDDVVFDSNSFTVPGETVTATNVGTVVHFKTLDMSQITNSPILDLTGAQANGLTGKGSVTLSSDLTIVGDSSNNGICLTGFPIGGALQTTINLDFQGVEIPGFIIDGGTIDQAAVTVNLLENNFFGWSFFLDLRRCPGSTFNSNDNDIFAPDITFLNIETVNLGTSTLHAGLDGPSSLKRVAINGGTFSGDFSIVLDDFLAAATLVITDGSLYPVVASVDSIDLSGQVTLTFGSGVTVGSMSFNQASDITISDSATSTYTMDTFDSTGTEANPISIGVSGGAVEWVINVSSSVAWTNPTGNHASGAGTPIGDLHGVDGGDNVNWFFLNPSTNLYLQNVFMVGAATNGTVQFINLGKSDDGTAINYEVETQDLEFGDRAHLKKMADKIVVFSKDGMDSKLSVKTNDNEYESIENIDLNRRVAIGESINVEGNFFKFKWFGQTTKASPVLEGFTIEDIDDLGLTKP